MMIWDFGSCSMAEFSDFIILLFIYDDDDDDNHI